MAYFYYHLPADAQGERERTETVHLVVRNKTLFVLIIKQGESY